MKKVVRMFSAVLFSTLLFTACSKDDDKVAEPTITDVTIETDNNNYVYLNHYMYVKGNVNAPGKINKIKVQIHGDDDTYLNYEFELEDGVKGLTTYNLDEVIYIPNNTKGGNYHLHIEVIDQAGQEKDYEMEFTIIEPS